MQTRVAGFLRPNQHKDHISLNSMAVEKRTREESGSRPTKKVKTDDASSKKTSSAPRPVFTSSLVTEETDFPRGGGTSLTPFEYKGVREEGRREAEKDIAEASPTSL